MRKYENVDIVAALGAVVELNTEHYKVDFQYDIDTFKKAARNPNGENDHLLWLSRRSGTYCFAERDVYIKDTAAYNYWRGSADILGSQSFYPTVIVHDRILAFAVEIKGIENGRVKGDLYELDYRDHIRELDRTALPRHAVTVTHEDGAVFTLPPKEYDSQRERLAYQHGKVTEYRSNPEDGDALRDILKQARDKRGDDARPAIFKLRVKNPKQPSIKQQLAAGKKQLAAERAAASPRAAVKARHNVMEV